MKYHKSSILEGEKMAKIYQQSELATDLVIENRGGRAKLTI